MWKQNNGPTTSHEPTIELFFLSFFQKEKTYYWIVYTQNYTSGKIKKSEEIKRKHFEFAMTGWNLWPVWKFREGGE